MLDGGDLDKYGFSPENLTTMFPGVESIQGALNVLRCYVDIFCNGHNRDFAGAGPAVMCGLFR